MPDIPHIGHCLKTGRKKNAYIETSESLSLSERNLSLFISLMAESQSSLRLNGEEKFLLQEQARQAISNTYKIITYIMVSTYDVPLII